MPFPASMLVRYCSSTPASPSSRGGPRTRCSLNRCAKWANSASIGRPRRTSPPWSSGRDRVQRLQPDPSRYVASNDVEPPLAAGGPSCSCRRLRRPVLRLMYLSSRKRDVQGQLTNCLSDIGWTFAPRTSCRSDETMTRTSHSWSRRFASNLYYNIPLFTMGQPEATSLAE